MSIAVGAQRFGVSLRYDTGDGAVTAAIVGRCARTPHRQAEMDMNPTPLATGIGEKIARLPGRNAAVRAISRVTPA